jgi:hypothetical protein
VAIDGEGETTGVGNTRIRVLTEDDRSYACGRSVEGSQDQLWGRSEERFLTRVLVNAFPNPSQQIEAFLPQKLGPIAG